MTPNYSLIPWIQWVISRIHANTFFKTSKNLNKKKINYRSNSTATIVKLRYRLSLMFHKLMLTYCKQSPISIFGGLQKRH